VRGEEDEYQCGERRGGRGTDSAETAEKPVSSGGSQRREDREERSANNQVATPLNSNCMVGMAGCGSRRRRREKRKVSSSVFL
jgi:hypothetical protein